MTVPSSLGPFARALAVAAVATLPLLATAGKAEAQRMGRTIVVEGSGVATAAPDMARVVAGVETAAETADAALAANGRAMEAVFAALEAAGIPERRIATADFDVIPRYPDRRAEGEDATRIAGYTVRNQVVVTVEPIAALGPLLDRLVAAGANRIERIAFGLADPEPVLAEARRAAVADATARARLYADAAGVALGPVLGIDDTGGGGPGPRPAMRAMAMDAAPAVPIAEGERSVSARVRMVWRIAGSGEGDAAAGAE